MQLTLIDAKHPEDHPWEIFEWQRSILLCLSRIRTLPRHEVLPCSTSKVMCIVFYELKDFVEVDLFVKFWEAKYSVAWDKNSTTALVMLAPDGRDLPDEMHHLHATVRRDIGII